MKTIQYILIGDYSNSPGVLKKVNYEIDEFRNAGIKCELLNLTSENTRLISAFPFNSKQNYKSDKYDLNADYWYIRHVPLTYPLLRLVRNAHKHRIKVIMEIGTYPSYRQELKEISNPITYYRDVIYSKLLKWYTDRIVIVTDFDRVFGIPTIKISNMAVVDKIKPISTSCFSEKKEIHILAVARVAYWHGYDRMIEGLREYYESGEKEYKVVFHIVGVGSALKDLQETVVNYDLADYVKFHGMLTGEPLDEVFDMADIGIDCLGSHRKGDHWFGTIKSMEYISRGLPFITEYPIPDSVKKVKKFILKVPEDESSINIGEVIKFFIDLKQEDRQTVVNLMRSFAYSYCDISVAMKPVIDYLLEENK